MSQEDAYNFMLGKDWLDSGVIADNINVGRISTTRCLRKLIEQGLIERVQDKKNKTYYYKANE